MSGHSPFEIGILTRPETLDALRDDWTALAGRCPDATPFQRPEWLLPWCAHFGPERIWTLALRRDRRLVGLAPFFIYAKGSERTVALLGAGISDYLDALIDPDFKKDGAEAITAQLEASSALWDALDFESLRPGSPLLAMRVPSSWRDGIVVDSACPRLHLPDSPTGLGVVVPRQMLRNVRRAKVRAACAGGLVFETADAASWTAILDELLALHAARRLSRDSVLPMPEDTARAFHREVSAGLALRGALRLHAVRLDGRLIAGLYGFAQGSRAYFYLQGFDPEYEQLSPGTLALAYAIEEAIRGGADEADFLRGQEAYKYHWGAKDQLTYRRRIRRYFER